MSKAPETVRSPEVEIGRLKAENYNEKRFAGAVIWLSIALALWAVIFMGADTVARTVNTVSPVIPKPPGSTAPAGAANSNKAAEQKKDPANFLNDL